MPRMWRGFAQKSCGACAIIPDFSSVRGVDNHSCERLLGRGSSSTRIRPITAKQNPGSNCWAIGPWNFQMVARVIWHHTKRVVAKFAVRILIVLDMKCFVVECP